ncbi:MAG: histidine kinase [Bacteroidetes bacterium]|nr:histidine kinase [Bacteroidota bacterium]
MFRLVFFCFLVLGWCPFLGGQSPAYRKLDYSNGLPTNVVYDILQDSRGYMWIGHEKGLSRYDGVNFKTWFNKNQKSKAVSNLQEDINGQIWCQSFTGQVMHTLGDELVLEEFLSGPGNYIPFQLQAGRYFITVRDGYCLKYDIRDKKIVGQFNWETSFIASNMLIDGEDIYGLAMPATQLIRIRKGKAEHLCSVPVSMGSPYGLLKFNDKILMFSKSGTKKIGIYQEGKGLEIRDFGSGAFMQSAEILDGQLYVSTAEGVYTYNQNLEPLQNGEPFFKEASISNSVKDREGSLWFTTLNQGIYFLPNLNVSLIRNENYSFTALTPYAKNSSILIGTRDNYIWEYLEESHYFWKIKQLSDPHAVVTIFDDKSNDRLLIGSDKLYGLQDEKITFTDQLAVKDIEYVEDGVYFMALGNGLFLYNASKDGKIPESVQKIIHRKIEWRSSLFQLSEGIVRARCVGYDTKNRILYGSGADGTFVYSSSYNGPLKYNGKPVFASDIYIQNGEAYIATFEGDLLVVFNNKVLRKVNLPANLKDLSIVKLTMVEDELWVLYENFILKANLEKGEYDIYSASDGLPKAEIRDFCITGRNVYLATSDGLAAFPRKLASKNKTLPLLQIDVVYVNGQRAASQKDNNEFGTAENNVEIHYNVLSYKGASEIKIFYKINNGNWRQAESQNRILYLASLSPGSYKVYLKAQNEDGVESKGELSYAFTIAYPFWQRWWFILLLILLLGALTYVYMRWRIADLHRKSELKQSKYFLEKELQSSMLASLKVQMNPHFIFNAMNTIQSYIFLNDRENASQYLNQFSELMRMILDMSAREKVSLYEELKSLKLYLQLEHMRFEESLKFEVHVDPGIVPDMIQIPPMLIQPYVENAIKHGLFNKKGNKKIVVSFNLKDNILIATVEDDGIGRKKAAELQAQRPRTHESFATRANQKRLELLNQGRSKIIGVEFVDKVDSDGNALGTKVILNIPL